MTSILISAKFCKGYLTPAMVSMYSYWSLCTLATIFEGLSLQRGLPKVLLPLHDIPGSFSPAICTKGRFTPVTIAEGFYLLS